jgi:MAF protein
MSIVLASNSPRRGQLLSLTGWEFTTFSTQVDERPLENEEPVAYVLRMAGTKARDAASQLESGDLVIAADTTVVDGGEILGKPADQDDALSILSRLRGHIHRVYTAVAVLNMVDDTLIMDLCATEVPMRDYSDEEMQTYVGSGDPMDKAGAYAIQHAGFHPVEYLDGCYANVMGLPLCHLARTLRNFDHHAERDIPQSCQRALEYSCPIYSDVLNGQSTWNASK